MTFLTDIKKGDSAEQSVATILSEHWFVEQSSSLHKGSFTDWDLIAVDVDEVTDRPFFTVEVKYDEMQSSTGNIAIEIHNSKSDKPSGLSATKADLWCHVLKDSAWITSVKKLKEFCKEHKPLRKVGAAGDGNASILLYKTEDILTIFERIDGCHKEQLQSKISSLLK